jgi:diadenosine tetraphosphate (Ap4A) HIT family hydrolase
MNQNIPLFTSAGGSVLLPITPLNCRQDGGHLLVNPPREVWERSELTAEELMHWSFLIAATGEAMLYSLPQLADGCLNYWEAGNWALNNAAAPLGPKTPREHRRVHLHVFGRSRTASHEDWQWGESPSFPPYAESKKWSSQFELLTSEECTSISKRIEVVLREKFDLRLR